MHTDTYNLEVSIGQRTYRPVLHVQSDGLWSINDDGLGDYCGDDHYREWLIDTWHMIKTGQRAIQYRAISVEIT